MTYSELLEVYNLESLLLRISDLALDEKISAINEIKRALHSISPFSEQPVDCVEGEVTEADFVELTDDVTSFGEESEQFRTVNTSDESRVFHTYEKWECYKAGFYASSKPGMTKAQCEEAYRDFLADEQAFRDALQVVIKTWKHSCEHYLTNSSMNRIAWLGQAAACQGVGLPATFRSGFYLLSEEQQAHANEIALEALNEWMQENGRPTLTMEEAYSYDRQSDIY